MKFLTEKTCLKLSWQYFLNWSICLWSVLPYEGGVRVVGAGRAVPIDAHAPFCPLLAAGEEAWTWTQPSLLSASPGIGLPVLSVRPFRSAVGQLIGEGAAGRIVFFGGFFLLLCCLGPRKVPNAERSTRCPGANLEADRSTWVQFKVSRRERRCVGTLKLLGTDVMMLGFFFLGKTKINSSHSFCFIASLRMDWMRAGHQLPNNGLLLF